MQCFVGFMSFPFHFFFTWNLAFFSQWSQVEDRSLEAIKEISLNSRSAPSMCSLNSLLSHVTRQQYSLLIDVLLIVKSLVYFICVRHISVYELGNLLHPLKQLKFWFIYSRKYCGIIIVCGGSMLVNFVGYSYSKVTSPLGITQWWIVLHYIATNLLPTKFRPYELWAPTKKMIPQHM